MNRGVKYIRAPQVYCRKITLLVLPRKLNANYTSGKYIKDAIATLAQKPLLRFDNCRIQQGYLPSKKIHVVRQTQARINHKIPAFWPNEAERNALNLRSEYVTYDAMAQPHPIIIGHRL